MLQRCLRPNFKGNSFWWLVSIFVFPVVITISILIGTLFGGLELNGEMLPVFLSMILTGLISALIKNIFEEFAWRRRCIHLT
jgi:hypothetical protein